jgi:hypothetical protein
MTESREPDAEWVRLQESWTAGSELRAVTLADAPGHGRVRRLIVMDLEEYARWHGRPDE